jgi:hypothetical protein
MLEAKKPLSLLPSNSGSKSTRQLLSSDSIFKSTQQVHNNITFYNFLFIINIF